MAFRATTQIPVDGYVAAKREAVQLKLALTAAIATLGGGPTNGYAIKTNVFQVLKRARDVFTNVATIPGMAAYAQAQESDVTYNPAAEFTAMLSAIDGALTWISTNIPADGSGWVAVEKWNADGTVTDRTFTPAETAGLVTELQAVIATIA